MGLLDKIKYKTTDRIADKVSDKIVNKMFGKSKKEAEQEAIQARGEAVTELQRTNMAAAEAQANADQEAYARAVAAGATQGIDAEKMGQLMGMAYNTKRCPSCQAVCINSPAECPYCHADLKSVKPMTPEELEKLE